MNESTQSCLVIPDVHQNIAWVDAILAKEAPAADRIIFLGDYFDAKLESAASPAETARYLSSLKSQHAAAFTFLTGNHDLPYLYDLQNDRGPDSYDRNPYSNGAYDPQISLALKAHLAPDLLDAFEPFTFAGDWLLSHAGLHVAHLGFDMELNRDGLAKLYQTLKAELERLSTRRNPALAAIGIARGGLEQTGGLTWLDWYQEFEDTFPWPQLVGHTILPEPNQKGRSWDIDTRSGHYALIGEKGLEIKSMPKA